jgi:hypothetical protein
MSSSRWPARAATALSVSALTTGVVALMTSGAEEPDWLEWFMRVAFAAGWPLAVVGLILSMRPPRSISLVLLNCVSFVLFSGFWATIIVMALSKP